MVNICYKPGLAAICRNLSKYLKKDKCMRRSVSFAWLATPRRFYPLRLNVCLFLDGQSTYGYNDICSGIEHSKQNVSLLNLRRNWQNLIQVFENNTRDITLCINDWYDNSKPIIVSLCAVSNWHASRVDSIVALGVSKKHTNVIET